MPEELMPPPGALPDMRSDEEKSKDWRVEELVAAGPVEWKEKKPEEWRHFPIFDQDGSSSCVANGGCKALGIGNAMEENGAFVNLSRRDFYERRVNKPGLGMSGPDAAEIGNRGVTLEALMPSDGLSEETMNDASDRRPSFDLVARIYRAGGSVVLPNCNIERVAQVIAAGHGVVLFFSWDVDEWDQPIPKILRNNPQYRHGVCGVDFGLLNGEKGIVIDESWGKNRGWNGQRFLREEWFAPANNRNFWAHYWLNRKNAEDQALPAERPVFRGTKELIVGSTGDDVAQLQRCLGYLQDSTGFLFPLTQAPTGYFGGITRSGVKRYQNLRLLPVTGVADSVTLASLRRDFAA